MGLRTPRSRPVNSAAMRPCLHSDHVSAPRECPLGACECHRVPACPLAGASHTSFCFSHTRVCAGTCSHRIQLECTLLLTYSLQTLQTHLPADRVLEAVVGKLRLELRHHRRPDVVYLGAAQHARESRGGERSARGEAAGNKQKGVGLGGKEGAFALMHRTWSYFSKSSRSS